MTGKSICQLGKSNLSILNRAQLYQAVIERYFTYQIHNQPHLLQIIIQGLYYHRAFCINQKETIQKSILAIFMQSDKKAEKDKKEITQFKKYLHAHLKEFQKCREWADINNWLHNMHKFLENKRFEQLPNSVLLAKRLAQCLTNTLPAGVHQYALKVYTLILTNFQDIENIRPLMSIGLFPFFQVSSSHLKLQLLKIYENFFLNDDGCLQMTISLMNALLTGLNQNNEQLAKKIFILCEKISKRYGYIWIDGAVWVNILKSSKVKIAGFKYFMKVFKDRDKQKAIKEQSKQQNEQAQKDAQQTRQRKISITKKSSMSLKARNNYLKDQERLFLAKLYQQKYIEDGSHNRYPNFSLLVVNAIRSCLEPDVDSFAKRAALQHISTYLKLSENSIVSQNDAFVLVSSMLRVLTFKQFSLTRRIYLYLFDQPNSQGQYLIDAQQRKLQLSILVSSLKRMLKQDDQQFTAHKNYKSVQSTLSIIEILVKDHPKLANWILPQLSYDILRFLKGNCFSNNNTIVKQLKKKIFQFNENLIIPYKMIFLEAILVRVQKKQEQEKIVEEYQQEIVYSKGIQKQFIEVIKILDFYIYTLYKAKYQSQTSSGNNKGSIKKSNTSSNDQEGGPDTPDELKQICLTTIEKILDFLKISKLNFEKLSYQALDFANKINTQTLSKGKTFEFHQRIVQKIDDLISLQPGQGLYARLVTLHPSPKKQILLPYINEGAFAVVCIQNLLPPMDSNHKVELSKQEQKQIFFAVFKLLECHLWQQQAFQFVKIFIQKYQSTFKQQIDRTDGSQWLIYWRLAQGDVKGGVIRMILNAQSQNPLKKHMSRKWIQANQQIISKIIEPIFTKLNTLMDEFQTIKYQHELQRQIELIFNMVKIIFQSSNESFERFFFLQQDKYLSPLLEMIFLNLGLGTQKLKTKSMDMLKYVLSKAATYDEKYTYINLTLPRILSIFRHLISKKMDVQQNQNNVLEDKLFTLARVSSFDRSETHSYLQEIQIVEYLANLNVSIRKSLKDKQFRGQSIIELFQKNGMYVEVIKGLFQSDLPYIRTLYLDFLRDSCDLLARSQGSKDLLNVLVNLILDKLFLILKTQDITQIQETIRQKKQNNNLKNSIHRTRRMSSHDLSQDQQMQKLINSTKVGDTTNSFYIAQQGISKNDMNIEAKYAQIIEMWNSVKFYTKFSIDKGIQNLPIVNLLSLILQSFPFSYLKYTQMITNTQNQGAVDNYQLLQEQINKVTGLKKQVLEIIDIVWSKFNVQICQFLIERGDPRILIHCTIDPIKVLTTIIKNSKIRQINKYYFKSVKLHLPKNVSHYSGELLMKQNQVCYFLFLYLMYCNFGLINNKKLSTFLEQLLNILRVLRVSQHIQTKIWIFQMVHLLSERILLNKEIYIEGGSKIRQELQQLTKQTLDQLLKCITKSKNFTYKTQIKTGLMANFFSKQQKQVATFDFIKMNPPTIFVMSQNYGKRRNKRNFISASTSTNNSKDKKQFADDKVEIINQNELIEAFLFEKWNGLTEQTYQNYLAICCIKTLISISCPLIINIFEKDLIKVSYIIKDIILTLLPICQDKNQENQFRIQLISEYIYGILQNKPLKSQILPLIRRNILTIFMGNDFFKTTKRSLYYWKEIIDACTQGEKNNGSHDLLGELLARQAGLFQGLLKGKEQVLRQKIKSFERICFVIYSGRMDKYENKLSTVLLFLNDVMKQENCSPALLILMLFCIRILFMRLSQTSLNKMFKSIWPGLITILIQIFNTKEKKKNKNINLILAALKVVELIHALEMQEFNFHKWIFVTDCNFLANIVFGIGIQPLGGELSFQESKPQILTPFIFKPYLTNLLPDHSFKCDFLPKPSQNMRQTLRQQKQKRKIIIKQANVDTIEQLQNLAFILMQYMIDCNQKRIEVSKIEIEEIIEADFISLDDYIFEVK